MGDVTLKYLLFGEDRTASKTLRNVGIEAGRTGTALEGIGARASKAGVMIGTALAGVAVAGAAGLAAATAAGVTAAAEYQTLAAKTDAVLKSTGNAARQSVKGIQDRASALESMSGVDETLIINGQNVLATFTQVQDRVGAGNDIFSQATARALDMSVALGTDLQTANIQLGKALNDPVKGITALSKAGVSFTAQQKDQIKTLVAHGDVLGAQKVILSELTKEFGGAAKAAGEGFEGSMARAKDAVSDTFRDIGMELLPVLTKLADWFTSDGLPAIKAFASDALPKLRAAWDTAWDVVEKKVIPLLREVSQWVIEHVVPAVKDLSEKVLSGLKAAWEKVSTALEEHRPQLEKIGAVLKALAEFIADKVAPVVGTVLSKAFEYVGTYIGFVIEQVSNAVEAFRMLGEWGQWLWNNALAPAIRFILNGFAAVTDTLASLLGALGNVPGFEWAKTAADNMRGAADKARDLASNIRDIPDSKDVAVTMRVGVSSQMSAAALNALTNGTMGFRGFAAGGTNIAAGLAWVGEQGPELIHVPGGSTIYDARTSARMASPQPSQSLIGVRMVGTLDTPWGPAQVDARIAEVLDAQYRDAMAGVS